MIPVVEDMGDSFMVESTHTAGFWPALTEPLRTFGARVADWFAPASEASSDKDTYEISLELPGVAKDDIEVTMKDHLLTVKGEKRAKREMASEDGGMFFCERQYGAFQRSFRMPPDSAGDKVDASFSDGVLTIRVPRKVRQDDGRKISIRAS
jgi:HSP20 family protein